MFRCCRRTNAINLIPEERTTFWQFLSDVMRHTGWRLWVLQGIVLLLVCAGIFSIPDTPNIIPVFMPLFILACLPSFYESSAFGMREIEAVTRASSAQIILAKLVIAGASEIICLTIICWICNSYCCISDNTYPTNFICCCSFFGLPDINPLEYADAGTLCHAIQRCFMLRHKRTCRSACTLASCTI